MPPVPTLHLRKASWNLLALFMVPIEPLALPPSVLLLRERPEGGPGGKEEAKARLPPALLPA